MRTSAIKCPSCGSILNVDVNGREFVFCNYCGEQIHLDTGNRTININQNISKSIRIEKNIHTRHTDDAKIIKEKVKDRENKRGFILLLVAVLLPFAIVLCMKIHGSVSKSQGKIQGGFYRDYLNQQYDVVEKQLQAAGFTNIEIIDLNDPGIFGTHRGKVQSVSIAGKSSFDSYNWFDPDDKVIISHR